jgi:hypothetical protein
VSATTLYRDGSGEAVAEVFDDHQRQIDALVTSVGELRARFETRDAYPAMLDSAEPVVRTRIRTSHSRTQRDGWGYESTVETEFFGRGAEDARVWHEAMQQLARELGEQERDARNTRERAVAP